MSKKGIDVSEFQGKIDWEKVKNDGIEFAILRCGYGMDFSNQDDVEYERNANECERLGIPYGVYIYSYATNTTRASSEADHVLRLIDGLDLSYPVYYDMEDSSTINSDLAAIAKTFCNKISNSGYSVGVYANLDWWNNRLTDSCFDNWHKWVAQWNETCDYTKPYAMWQYSSSGAVNGINGRVDMNYLIGYPSNHGSFVQATARIYGKNRYETSVKVADSLKYSYNLVDFPAAVIACGDNYPDALSGSYLAKCVQAPILLVGNDDQSQKMIQTYISNNVSAKGKIYLLGGNGAISSEFENCLSELGYDVVRLGGKTRYETNLLILNELNNISPIDSGLLICSGNGFADSLSASAVNFPIMIVDDDLTEEQLDYYENMSPENVFIIGGEGAVNIGIESTLKKSGNVQRISGKNRYETSMNVATTEAFFNKTVTDAILAYAHNFPDGLCGGPVALSLNAPLILTDNTNAVKTNACIEKLRAKNIVVLGGPALISNDALNKIIK